MYLLSPLVTNSRQQLQHGTCCALSTARARQQKTRNVTIIIPTGGARVRWLLQGEIMSYSETMRFCTICRLILRHYWNSVWVEARALDS